ncbi:MAG: hypothetical protein QW279_14405 [Candidatus Jordarchaeaceae archaeon]
MGADLYIDKIFKPNFQKNKRYFNRAVKERDSTFLDFKKVDEIDSIVRKNLGLPERKFGDPMVLIPKNMTLDDAELNQIRDKYNRFVKAQARVTKYYNKMYEVGYFRDSYNETSLFWHLNMSWWNCPYIKNGKISPDDAKDLLDEIRSKEIPPITIEELKNRGCLVDDENTVESWNNFFLDKKERFCAFLQEAIDKGLSIKASV